MTKVLSLCFLTLFIFSCSKSDGGSSHKKNSVTQPSLDPNNSSTTAGSTAGGISGGSSTGGSTGGGTVTTGGTTGGSTGGTSGGSSTGGSSTGGSAGLPNEAYTFETNIIFVKANSAQVAKFQKALGMIKDVIATEEFRTRVLNHTYNGEKTFVDNGGFTNAQIYQKILEAAETLQPDKNNTMDMEIELYTAFLSTTIGYTNSSSKRIWMNTKYFNKYDYNSVAKNVFHEWIHKLGFKHSATATPNREFSVPYALGKIISEIGKNYM